MRIPNAILASALLMGLISCGGDAPKPRLPAAFPTKIAAPVATSPASAPVASDPLTSSATSNALLIELPCIAMPKPAAWTWVKPSMAFRTLQYIVNAPTVSGSPPDKLSAPADLIVSVFASGDGGSVEANIERWKNQFQNADATPALASITNRMIAGVPVTRVDLKGAWKGMGMNSAQVNSLQLAAAIVLQNETIYIRLVGPAPTVEAARAQFEAMLDGLSVRASRPPS